MRSVAPSGWRWQPAAIASNAARAEITANRCNSEVNTRRIVKRGPGSDKPVATHGKQNGRACRTVLKISYHGIHGFHGWNPASATPYPCNPCNPWSIFRGGLCRQQSKAEYERERRG
jgi:hypothetical protein